MRIDLILTSAFFPSNSTGDLYDISIKSTDFSLVTWIGDSISKNYVTLLLATTLLHCTQFIT